jgi:hypothetical protein
MPNNISTTTNNHEEDQSNNPLMDYSNSHVVTSDQYLVILKQKVMDKNVVDKLRE